MSDLHTRLLRQAAKAARVRLRAFSEDDPASDEAVSDATRARQRTVLSDRASSTEAKLRDSQRRRQTGRLATDHADSTIEGPAQPTNSPPALERGSDGVLRLPPQ
jgi:hypothetical protein